MDLSTKTCYSVNEASPSSTDVLPKASNLVISHCFFADDGKEMDKNEKRTARAESAKLLYMQICNVLVAVVVGRLKAP